MVLDVERVKRRAFGTEPSIQVGGIGEQVLDNLDQRLADADGATDINEVFRNDRPVSRRIYRFALLGRQAQGGEIWGIKRSDGMRRAMPVCSVSDANHFGQGSDRVHLHTKE